MWFLVFVHPDRVMAVHANHNMIILRAYMLHHATLASDGSEHAQSQPRIPTLLHLLHHIAGEALAR